MHALEGEKENTIRYRSQLHKLIDSNDQVQLIERIRKGSDYYRDFLWDKVKLLLTHTLEMRQHKRVKTYLNSLTELDQLLSKKLEEVDKSLTLIEGILQGNQSFDFSGQATERLVQREQLLEEIQKKFPGTKTSKKKSKKTGKRKDGISTYDITLKMWSEGKDIKAIADERGLVQSTIEGHLAKAVTMGTLPIFQFIGEDDVDVVTKAIAELPEGYSSKDLFLKLDGKYSYPKLRAVMHHSKSGSRSPSE